MRVTNHIVAQVFCLLIAMAAVTAIGVTALVFTGDEHRETVTAIARQFFVLVEKASRARRSPVNASTSPKPEGGTIQ
jgi:hypothetical protein